MNCQPPFGCPILSLLARNRVHTKCWRIAHLLSCFSKLSGLLVVNLVLFKQLDRAQARKPCQKCPNCVRDGPRTWPHTVFQSLGHIFKFFCDFLTWRPSSWCFFRQLGQAEAQKHYRKAQILLPQMVPARAQPAFSPLFAATLSPANVFILGGPKVVPQDVESCVELCCSPIPSFHKWTQLIFHEFVFSVQFWGSLCAQVMQQHRILHTSVREVRSEQQTVDILWDFLCFVNPARVKTNSQFFTCKC